MTAQRPLWRLGINLPLPASLPNQHPSSSKVQTHYGIDYFVIYQYDDAVPLLRLLSLALIAAFGVLL